MVLLFGTRQNKYEKEIIEILKKHGANHISDKVISEGQGDFTIISIYKKAEITLDKGIAVFLNETAKFSKQKLPIGIIGICEEKNSRALENFSLNNITVLTCGIGSKNTVTISSISNNTLLATIQRTIIDTNGNLLNPCEIKIHLTKEYLPYSIMVAVAILLLLGITPTNF